MAAGIATVEGLAAALEPMRARHGDVVVEQQLTAQAELLVAVRSGPLGGLVVIGFGGSLADALGRQVVLSPGASREQIATALGRSPLGVYLDSVGRSHPEAGNGAGLRRTIADFVRRLCEVVESNGLDSLEINPVMVTSAGAFACDVKARRGEAS